MALIFKHVDAVSLEHVLNVHQVMKTVVHALDHGYLLLALVTDQRLFLESEGINVDEIEFFGFLYPLVVHTEEFPFGRYHLDFRIKIPEQRFHQLMETVEH